MTILYLAMLCNGVSNEKPFLSTTMMDFDLLRIKWARFYHPLAELLINSRKSLSLSMQSSLSRPTRFIQQAISTSSLHQSNRLLLLVPSWTRLENMSWILSVSSTTRMPSLCTSRMCCLVFRLGRNPCQPACILRTLLVQLLRFCPH